MPTAQTRIEWIDEYKGFVLLLVCLYHCEQYFANIYMGMEHLSALRMSAFFFISGVLFSARRFPKFKDYCIHKSRVLLVPYLALSLLFLAIDPVVWNFDWFPNTLKMTILKIHPDIQNLKDYLLWNLAKIFFVGKSSIASGPLWFVFTLFSVSLLFHIVYSFADKVTTTFKRVPSSKIIIAIFAIASLAIGWTMSRHHVRLPFGIERDVTTLFFFACGYLSKDFIKRTAQFISSDSSHKTSRKFRIGIVAAATIASLTFYGFVEKPSIYFSIMDNELGWKFWQFLGSSFFGIFGLVGAFQIFSALPRCKFIDIIKGIFRNISRNALVILAAHWWILLLIRIVFKQELDKPLIAYSIIAIITAGTIAAIPFFRCKLYKFLGKERISVKESLSIK